MINIIKDVEPIWEVDNYDVVLVGVSIFCNMSNGFAMKIGNKYPEVLEANRSTNYADTRKYGKRIVIDGKPIISLLFICGYKHGNRDYLNYEALENALSTANAEFKGKKVLTTLLGASRFDGNGDRDKCLEIIERCTKDMDVDVYDYEQLSRDEEYRKVYRDILKKRYILPKEEYKALMVNRFKLMNELYIRRISDEAKASEEHRRFKKKRTDD